MSKPPADRHEVDCPAPSRKAAVLASLKASSGLFALALTFVTLIVAIGAVVIAIGQFRDAKRASALNAAATIIDLYSSPKARLYDLLLERAYLLIASEDVNPDHADGLRLLANINLKDYLDGIEFACEIYLNESLDDEQKHFVANRMKGDLELLLLAYDKNAGVVFDDNTSFPIRNAWIAGTYPDRPDPYPATRECVQMWDLSKKPTDPANATRER